VRANGWVRTASLEFVLLAVSLGASGSGAAVGPAAPVTRSVQIVSWTFRSADPNVWFGLDAVEGSGPSERIVRSWARTAAEAERGPNGTLKLSVLDDIDVASTGHQPEVTYRLHAVTGRGSILLLGRRAGHPHEVGAPGEFAVEARIFSMPIPRTSEELLESLAGSGIQLRASGESLGLGDLSVKGETSRASFPEPLGGSNLQPLPLQQGASEAELAVPTPPPRRATGA
jgi:hypothetical protein